jgi:hypothetical protein
MRLSGQGAVECNLAARMLPDADDVERVALRAMRRVIGSI